MKPKISIIIPVYNGSNYLREAIESALAQTYSNLEIIVVNDGSMDDGKTEEIALSYGNKIRYFKKENGGSSSALNAGIRAMQGEFFSWLSHDDLYLPEKIERSLSALQDQASGNSIVVCDSMLINGQGERLVGKKRKIEGSKSAEEAYKLLTHGTGINGCAVLIPKTVIDEVGFFDENMVYLNDLDYWHRILLNDVNVIYLNEKLVKCRIHDQQVSVKKINLFDSERHYLAEKIIRNASQFKMNKVAALRQIAYFCSAENLKHELDDTKRLLAANGGLSWALLFYLRFVNICGFLKRFLKYLRKKILFRR